MLILIGSTVSMFVYLSGMILSAPRMLFALGRDGFLPAAFARVHQRYHTPYIAIAVHTVIVITLAAVGNFETLGLIASGTILLVYAACCIAVLVLRRREIGRAHVW